ncbi:hypothetical protein SFRURICE_019139 [Spodoptera frugiperda]|uniref:SFRICE_012268 n=1 Tax=Spodoptera frugiperda TaxID=7108 RepID=A0A2H1W1E7_SPOFR|nr:hypothetical protein SFRURICE_019139 [Spodoptera frugiperda]
MMDSDLPPGSCNSTGHLSTIGYHTLPGRMHHSASTPAGVDGAGGGSRTPPATPKKGGKMLAVRVQMLDDSISMFQIQYYPSDAAIFIGWVGCFPFLRLPQMSPTIWRNGVPSYES